MTLDLEREIRKLPRLNSILLIGICKDSLAAQILGQRLKKTFPHLHIGVWGCSWITDMSGPSPVHRGIPVSPAHEKICRQEPFKSLLKRYGDPLANIRESNVPGLHLFAFYSSNQSWQLDRESTVRLEPYIEKTYVHEGKDEEHHTQIHGKIIQLIKQTPELVQQWTFEMFHLMQARPDKLPPDKKTPDEPPKEGTLQHI